MTTTRMIDSDKKATKQVLKEIKTKLTRMNWLTQYVDETDKTHLSEALKNIEAILNNIEKY